MIRSGLPPGSTTMAFFVSGSPMMVQLHCNGPTGKVSRISAGLGVVMEKSWTGSTPLATADGEFYRR